MARNKISFLFFGIRVSSIHIIDLYAGIHTYCYYDIIVIVFFWRYICVLRVYVHVYIRQAVATQVGGISSKMLHTYKRCGDMVAVVMVAWTEISITVVARASLVVGVGTDRDHQTNCNLFLFPSFFIFLRHCHAMPATAAVGLCLCLTSRQGKGIIHLLFFVGFYTTQQPT